jgi:Leucine-rich repeat (LRR) protein
LKNDLQVLIDFTILNPEIKDYKPLELGNQIWTDNRLKRLYLDGLEISNIPKSIQNLDSLEYLNLNNNKLQTLPETLCKIYSNLIWIDLTNNYLCPPYINCFDYIGQQNTEDCYHDFCPLGHTEIDGECYFNKDLAVLQDFIDENISLSGRGPLGIGVQKWKDMRLELLYLGANELTAIPESICEIYANLSALNFSPNQICPPYPACLTGIVIQQDTSKCP